MEAFGVLIVIGIVILAVIAIVAMKMIYICPPNSVLIFSGSRRTVRGKNVGYRLVQGGRGFRIPLLETVDKMDLTNMIIDLRVRGAFSKGGIPLNVDGVANVKIAGTEPGLSNAIERLLGKSRKEVNAIARETLEGNLRGVLATLTPEEVNQDRVKFAEELTQEADTDLQKLGIKLDTLKIQNVSDDSGYLDSIGRKQSADLIMRSRVAEAENKAISAERAAANMQTQEVAKIEANMKKAQADAEKRVIDAQTKKLALVDEERSRVVAAVAKAQAELGVQRARQEQVRLQLEADRIRPAEAQRQHMIETARGRSANIVERGKATAQALRRLSDTWNLAGEDARQVLVAQKLAPLVRQLMGTVNELKVDKVTMIDKELNKGGSNFAVNAAVTSEQLKHTMGIDVPKMMRSLTNTEEEGNPPPLPGV